MSARTTFFTILAALIAVLTASSAPRSLPQLSGPPLTVSEVSGALIGDSNSPDPDENLASISVFSRALHIIRQEYVESEKVNYRSLVHSAIAGILSSLDPHSQFMSPESFKAMREDTSDQFGGLGIKVEQRGGILTVVAPMEDSPAVRAGILSGDQIIEIDGKTTDKMTLPDSIRLLRGAPGTRVTLRIYRPAAREFRKIEIIREIIKVESVQGTVILPAHLTRTGRKIAYTRISQFNEPTAADLKRKLDSLETDGMEALILDLRNNPGGLIDSAVDVAAEFLGPDQLVVYTEGRDPAQRREYKTPKTLKPRKWFPMAVLINGGSASGSEIVAGALRDLNRAVIVGETSFGKGSVQTVQQLGDGSAIRLTTARYYTPGRQVIHERGITPAVLVAMSDEEEAAMMARRSEETLSDEEKARFKNVPDPQLARAIDLMNALLAIDARPTKPASTK